MKLEIRAEALLPLLRKDLGDRLVDRKGLYDKLSELFTAPNNPRDRIVAFTEILDNYAAFHKDVAVVRQLHALLFNYPHVLVTIEVPTE